MISSQALLLFICHVSMLAPHPQDDKDGLMVLLGLDIILGSCC